MRSVLKKEMFLDVRENKLTEQYYMTVIEQNNFFNASSNDRKNKQRLIAQAAKNDNQDRQEAEQRKKYFLLKMVNSYLHKAMEDMVAENKGIENSYEEIKLITVTF